MSSAEAAKEIRLFGLGDMLRGRMLVERRTANAEKRRMDRRDMFVQVAAGLLAALISGGECTVTIRGQGGRGGRCTEFLLALGIELETVWAIAADTDGIDGTEDNAGAILRPGGVKGRSDAKSFLERHDSYGFFRELGDLVVTGPTRTNVNDYRAILIP
jgi:glycerate-2-kinase